MTEGTSHDLGYTCLPGVNEVLSHSYGFRSASDGDKSISRVTFTVGYLDLGTRAHAERERSGGEGGRRGERGVGGGREERGGEKVRGERDGEGGKREKLGGGR